MIQPRPIRPKKYVRKNKKSVGHPPNDFIGFQKRIEFTEKEFMKKYSEKKTFLQKVKSILDVKNYEKYGIKEFRGNNTVSRRNHRNSWKKFSNLCRSTF